MSVSKIAFISVLPPIPINIYWKCCSVGSTKGIGAGVQVNLMVSAIMLSKKIPVKIEIVNIFY